MIEVRGVSKVYGEKKQHKLAALQDVSCKIPSGATASIMGKSGSGKSTLMHIMGGLDQPTSGEVVLDGNALTSLKRGQLDQFRAQDLGFIFQSFFVEGNKTCYRNVVLPLEINKIARRRRKKLVSAALESVDLLDKKGNKAKHLSGGQKQRLAIARAIVHRPKILLADEPTGNLDSATSAKIIKLLFDLNKSLKCTLIIVTHDAELAAHCKYQMQLKDGQIVSRQVAGKTAPKPKKPAAKTPKPALSPRKTAAPAVPKQGRFVQ